MVDPRLTEDRWLADRLGKPAYHLSGKIGQNGAGWPDVRRRLAAGPVFADAKVAVDDVAAIGLVQSAGFLLIDTNLRFLLPRESAPAGYDPQEAGFAAPEHADEVAALAGRVFSHDRFHRDPRIGHPVAAALKRDWARNFFSGNRGEWMVVARSGGKAAGFLQLLRSPDNELVIDLIGVDAACRGCGLARAMIAFAAVHCTARGALVVGTQVANLPSVRLYEGLGFRLSGAQYVFHCHGGTAC